VVAARLRFNQEYQIQHARKLQLLRRSLPFDGRLGRCDRSGWLYARISAAAPVAVAVSLAVLTYRGSGVSRGKPARYVMRRFGGACVVRLLRRSLQIDMPRCGTRPELAVDRLTCGFRVKNFI
jgi:hypothetical protein